MVLPQRCHHNISFTTYTKVTFVDLHRFFIGGGVVFTLHTCAYLLLQSMLYQVILYYYRIEQNHMNQVRHLKVKQLIEKRERAMFDALRDDMKEPRVYEKTTAIGVLGIVLLWYAFMASQMYDFVSIVASI